ncbi:MAG: hypothetical protein IT335_04895 [Thermomicrobiales bacterium]|nr:hypothetical protein [Thermomicrobiales bacterium]
MLSRLSEHTAAIDEALERYLMQQQALSGEQEFGGEGRGKALETLRHRDDSWDYAGEFTKRLTHGIHTYPAMMIPQVAARLIDRFTNEGDVVLDPFCGSGSVLVEARVAGRNSWGIDLNPLAALIAQVKSTPLADEILNSAIATVECVLPDFLCEPPSPPPVRNMDYWFKPEIVRQLSSLRAAIEKVQSEDARRFLLVTFSETVRATSNSRQSEFKRYRLHSNKLVNHKPNALVFFQERLTRNVTAMREFTRASTRLAWSQVLCADSRNPASEIPVGSVDTVVTSPPYGDSFTTVAYGDFSSFGSEWLGLRTRRTGRVDDILLGGRAVTGPREIPDSNMLKVALAAIADQDGRRAREVSVFYADLYQCIQQMCTYLRIGGYACIVIGNRRVKGYQLPTDLIIAEMGMSLGLRPVEVIVRRIPSKRMPSRNSPSNVAGQTEATMENEFIVIMQRSHDA